jgi:aspartyl-tRNA(Asn)/glutamyl-tRNA(Gln) amidotransferase subunit A
VAALRNLGAQVDVITLPDYELFNAVGRIILMAEAYAVHERNLKARPLDYGRFTHSRMVVGGMLSASDLMQALRLRRKLSQVVNNQVLGPYDAILAASALTPAAPFNAVDATMPPAFAIQTIPFNVTGNPAMSMPTGFSATGLPLSLQIVGKPFGDAEVLRIGHALEGALALTLRRPPLFSTGAA